MVNQGEKVGESMPTWFKPKRGGVVPQKRRLLKKMMFDYIVESIASLFQSCPLCKCTSGSALSTSNCSSSKLAQQQRSSHEKMSEKKKIIKDIFPYP